MRKIYSDVASLGANLYLSRRNFHSHPTYTHTCAQRHLFLVHFAQFCILHWTFTHFSIRKRYRFYRRLGFHQGKVHFPVESDPIILGVSNSGIKPESPALQADSLPSESPGKLSSTLHLNLPRLPDPKNAAYNSFFFFSHPSHQASSNSLPGIESSEGISPDESVWNSGLDYISKFSHTIGLNCSGVRI